MWRNCGWTKYGLTLQDELPKTGGKRRVKAHQKRRCPYCQCDKWEWLGAVPISETELARHLLVRYRCRKCGGDFVVEEAKPSRWVASAERCVHCHSRDVEYCSCESADIKLWRCRRCNSHMAMTAEDGVPPSANGGA